MKPLAPSRLPSTALLAGLLTAGSLLSYSPVGIAGPFYKETNLVTDDQQFLMSQGFAPAAVTDPNLINPWGVSRSATSPFWVSNQGSGTATLYNGAGQPFPLASPLVVTIPQSASPPTGPTGQIFNGTADFTLSNGKTGKGFFFFSNLDGSISGWNPSGSPTSAVQVVPPSNGAIYTGLAIGNNGSANFLYAADSRNGRIDVFDKSFARTTLAGSFTDPNTPAGFTPFNIQNLNGKLYVTYAIPGPAADAVDLGSGFVDVFDTNGNFLQRLTTGGTLASPWGLALAPANFGPFGNALLVGNFNDEHGNINAFDPNTGMFLGTLKNGNGDLLAFPDLWSLTFGNGANAGRPDELFFTAGIGDEQHGLFGKLAAVPLPATSYLMLAGLCALLMRGRLRKGPLGIVGA